MKFFPILGFATLATFSAFCGIPQTLSTGPVPTEPDSRAPPKAILPQAEETLFLKVTHIAKVTLSDMGISRKKMHLPSEESPLGTLNAKPWELPPGAWLWTM